MKKPLILFYPNLPLLSKNEMEVLDILIEAGKLIVPIYMEQENHDYPGGNLYPKGVSKSDIEKADKIDPEILSPYTVVEKINGKLVATPYHVKYAELLKPVADKLNQAAEATNNKEFSKRLKIQSKALLDGNYEKADLAWLGMKPYILDINIGPAERYDDKLFFKKTSYQAWVGVMDETMTKRAKQFRDIILSARRQTAISSEKLDFYEKVQIRTDDVVLFSGLISRTVFLGVNLPNNPNLMEKYGSEITLFKQANQHRVKDEIVPAFNKIFSPAFKKLYTPSDIEEGSLYSTTLHELAHVYLRYRDSEIRLKDLFPIIDELSAYVTGIRVGGHLLLKDVISSKQIESIMVAFLARSFGMVLYEKENKSKYHYMVGGAIFINYLFENEAIGEQGGVQWPNFTKMFFVLGELATILEKILATGTRDDAEKFVKRYGNTEKLQRFKK